MVRPVLEIAVLAPTPGDAAPPLPLLRLEGDADDRLLPRAQAAVRDALGVDRAALELFVPEVAADATVIPVLLVLEPGAGAPPTAAAAVAMAHLPGAIAARARDWADELAGRRPMPALRPAWARPGWTERIAGWLDAQLAWHGRPRCGPLEQQRTWSLSTLFRAETPGGAVWLKSCMPRFHAEPSLGRWLSERLPDAVPGVLATDAADRLVLLEEMDGPTVKESGGEETAPEAPAALARIARATEEHAGALRALGLHDRPLSRVPDQLRPVLLGPDTVASGGLGEARGRQVVAWVERQVADLERLGLPAALVHGDFHAGNVARHAGQLVIFDWSDAVVGHPLMDAAAWIWEARDEAALAARWETWVDAWSPRLPAPALRPLLEPVLGVGAAHQLISLDGILRAMEPELRHSLSWSAVAYAGVLDRLVPRG